MHNLHKFLLRSFRNTNRARTLRLRLHDVFNRDALEGRLDRELHIFARNFGKEAGLSC